MPEGPAAGTPCMDRGSVTGQTGLPVPNSTTPSQPVPVSTSCCNKIPQTDSGHIVYLTAGCQHLLSLASEQPERIVWCLIRVVTPSWGAHPQDHDFF